MLSISQCGEGVIHSGVWPNIQHIRQKQTFIQTENAKTIQISFALLTCLYFPPFDHLFLSFSDATKFFGILWPIINGRPQCYKIRPLQGLMSRGNE